MGAWVVSMNMVGYLPMDDEPATFAEWEEAAEHYKDFVKEWADQSDQEYDDLDCGHKSGDEHSDECYGSDTATVESILADEAMVPDKDYGMIINANDGKTMSLWLNWSDDVPTPED